MIRQVAILAISVQVITFNVVHTAKQQVPLSDSYLPVAMQVIAHLTDQMAFEARDEPKPTTSRPTKTTSRPTGRPMTTGKPMTPRPDAVYVNMYQFNRPGVSRQQTTPYHKPGIYAPLAPPKPDDRTYLLPPNQNAPYTVIQPQKTNTNEPLLSIHEDEVKPLIEPSPESHLLPPHFAADVDKISRSDSLMLEDWEENLQYLSPSVREMIKLANDPDDERLIEDVRAGPQGNKGGSKLSASNLRLLLLYDLLSREAKRQRLSDYYGFSPDVLQTLSESASGGARAQLRLALSKMVERKDCQHEYANNRAREMVDELARDESKLSSEIRYLQPLVYNRL
ncbi:uncharacterized protein LOC133529085 isoform X1 [Cydia pomonella]|uniref:uncharacterized protein LOC133529085 isoform X1 n=1 Tax=Cydia pomonella TaxID=82600 RepID=UPI002ADD7C52|nr:uncharacterized protein LOC133529085 isoform X1 [Cydia pomonella]XP_061722691.1 uncharacterized protein LOC133529085 isoform X1 [Cydia pomonella]